MSAQPSTSLRSADALLLLVVLVWGTDFAVLKSALVVMHPHVANALRFVVSAAVLGAFYEPSVTWGQVGWQAWGALLFSGGLAVGLMFVLWNRGVRRVGSSNTAVYYYLVPVVGMAVGVVALGEPVAPAQVTGGGLILGGLVLVRQHS